MHRKYKGDLSLAIASNAFATIAIMWTNMRVSETVHLFNIRMFTFAFYGVRKHCVHALTQVRINWKMCLHEHINPPRENSALVNAYKRYVMFYSTQEYARYMNFHDWISQKNSFPFFYLEFDFDTLLCLRLYSYIFYII